MTLKELIQNVQIRDKISIEVFEGDFVQKNELNFVKINGVFKSIYVSKRGIDFRHRLSINEIPEEYLDYEVYCICGLGNKYCTSIDIRKIKK